MEHEDEHTSPAKEVEKQNAHYKDKALTQTENDDSRCCSAKDGIKKLRTGSPSSKSNNVSDGTHPTSRDSSDDEKLAELVRHALENALPEEDLEVPTVLLSNCKQSITITEKQFQSLVVTKYAEAMARISYEKEMDNLNRCRKVQLQYYKKMKKSLKRVKALQDELDHLYSQDASPDCC